MTSPLIASVSAVSDLLDVFSSYDGGVIFSGLSGDAGLFGQIGWIFTAFGAFFTLWGFVLRSRNAGAEDKVGAANVLRRFVDVSGGEGATIAIDCVSKPSSIETHKHSTMIRI